MDKTLLSLRTLYRFLTADDYPVYSDRIISRKNHVGLTLVGFWRENLLPEWKSGRFGAQIWRDEGGRNRSLSDVCNRSDRYIHYREYAQELAAAAAPETIGRQAGQMAAFLVKREYDHDAFCRKLPVLLRLLEEADGAFTPDAAAFFRGALSDLGTISAEGRPFGCGWFLTMLALQALSGSGEGESALRKLRADPAVSMTALFAARSGGGRTEYLTGRSAEVCSAPLGRAHFFGRERELFDLREKLIAGGKYFLSGMGGVGKTELMRQLLRVCEQERLVDCICAVQYRGDLAESMVRAFPLPCGRSLEDNYAEAMARIRLQAAEGKRVLLVLDNMDDSPEEDPELLELAKLPAAVFVTSRRQVLPGFETVSIAPPTREAGALILRDSYGLPLGPEDGPALEEILNVDLWRHTLTLRLFGRAARSGRGALRGLLDRLRSEDGSSDLRGIYRHMAPGRGEAGPLLELLSLLPYQNYSVAFAQKYLGLLEPGGDVAESLARLWENGWLERFSNETGELGYAMHPFLAECIRPKTVTEETIAPFIDAVAGEWDEIDPEWEQKMAEHFPRLPSGLSCTEAHGALLDAAAYVSGPLSPRFLKLLLAAEQACNYACGATAEQRRLWEKLAAQCGAIPPELELCVIDTRVLCGGGTPEENEKKCRQLAARADLPREPWYYFLRIQAENYFAAGEMAESRRIAEELWSSLAAPIHRVAAARMLAMCEGNSGAFSEAERWYVEGESVLDEAGLTDGEEAMNLAGAEVAHYLTVYDLPKAEKKLQEVERLAAILGMDAQHRVQLLANKGLLYLQSKRPREAVEPLREARQLAGKVFSSRFSIVTIQVTNSLAVSCSRSGLYEEAEACFREEVKFYRENPGFDFDFCVGLYQFADLYINWGKPDKALKYARESLAVARQIENRQLAAEAEYTLSKAWRDLGDRERELQTLQACAPVLEELYGPDHHEVTDARRRLRQDTQGV